MKRTISILLVMIVLMMSMGCKKEEKDGMDTEKSSEEQAQTAETEEKQEEQTIEITEENFEQYFTVQTEILSSNTTHEVHPVTQTGHVYTHTRSVKFSIVPKRENMKIRDVTVTVECQKGKWEVSGSDSQTVNLSYKGEGSVSYHLSYKSPNSTIPDVSYKITAASGSIILPQS